jgi:hypothetical protein
LITSQARLRSEWRVAETDQVDENGVVKSKRRTLRHSVRAASIMDIVVDIVDVDEDVAVEDTEVEATAEMANQNVDVVAIEDVEIHKQLCSNCIFADSKATGRIGLSLRCTKSYSRLVFRSMRVKNWLTCLFSGSFCPAGR